MLFPDISPSREQIFDALGKALVGKNTRIYTDASLLLRTFEMSAAAREELLTALEGFSDRLAVPMWAANETWEYMREKLKPRPLQGPVQTLKNALEKFRADTLRYVDDDTVPELTKSEYESQLDSAMAAVRALTERLSNHEPKTDQTTARLMPFIEQRRLNSDLSTILAEVTKSAVARLSHSIPPGFGDSVPQEPTEDEPHQPVKSKGKTKNPHGDIIFWFEALAHCAQQDADQLVILTRDTGKRDWVYKPKKILDERGRPQLNEDVTLPLPLLTHEAMRACPKLKGLHVVSFEMLARVLQTQLKIQVPNLAAAIQANDKISARKTGPAVQPVESPEPARATVSGPAEVPSFGSADMTYDFPHNDEIDQLLRALSAEGWRRQNAVVRDLEPRLTRASRDQLVQIGRGLAHAANDGALEPVDFFHRVFANGSTNLAIRSNVLIGVLAEIYISESAEPQKPQATPGLVNFLYAHEANADLRPAYSAVISRLAPQRKTFLALPTDHEVTIPLEITLEGKRLRAVKAFGKSDLLEEDAPATRALRRTGQETTMSSADLMAELSREFVVPSAILDPALPPTTSIQVPENMGYVPWGPNTGATLR